MATIGPRELAPGPRRIVKRAFALLATGYLGTVASLALALGATTTQIHRVVSELGPSIRACLAIRGADLAAVQLADGPAPDPTSRLERLRGEVDAELSAFAVDGHAAAPPDLEASQRELFAQIRARLSGAPREALEVSQRKADGLLDREIERRVDAARDDDRRARELVAGLAGLCALSVLVGALAAVLLVRISLGALERFAQAERARQDEAERRAQELDLFSSMVAHDMRGPLNVMSLAVHAAQPEVVSASAQRALGVASRSIGRLTGMIDDLLQFARSGGQPDPHASAQLDEVLGGLSQDLQPIAEQHHVELSWRIATAEVAITGGALRSVVANLVENAIKYIDRGTARRVCIAGTAEPGQARITVDDTGPGIAGEGLSRVFEPFRRGTEIVSGYGLGLATVKRLVEAHGGTVAVQSAPGVGTSFTVLLPLAPARHVDGAEPTPTHA